MLSKKQRHTLRYTYIQIDTKGPIALLSKLTYESDVTIQNKLAIKKWLEKYFKRLCSPFFFFPFCFQELEIV